MMKKLLLLLTPSCSPPVGDEMILNDDFCVPHDEDDPNRYIMGRSVLVNLNDILAGYCVRTWMEQEQDVSCVVGLAGRHILFLHVIFFLCKTSHIKLLFYSCGSRWIMPAGSWSCCQQF